MPEYFIILMALLLISAVLHQVTKVKVYQSLKQFLFMNGVTLITGVIWDQYALMRGHWNLSQQFLLGPKVGYMPLEEILLIIILTYFGVVISAISEKMK